MNKDQMNQIWDEYRDGTLSAADRAAFEAYLQAHEPAAAMWHAESQWLDLLAEADAAGEQQGRPTPAFVHAVVAGWQSQESGVIGRIGWRRYVAPAMGIAAVVAVFVLAALYADIFKTAAPPPERDVARVTPPSAAPDAISLLMASAKDGYSLAAAQPARIRQGFSSTAAFLDVSRLAEIFDPGVPDPAEFVEPRTGG